MGENSKFSVKAVIFVISVTLVLAFCVGIAVYYVKSRNYNTVDVTSNTTTAAVSHAYGNQSQLESNVGIAISSNASLPDDFNSYRFIKQGYELSRNFAINSFGSVNNISVNNLVQYAFCYLYTEDKCLVDTAAKSMTYRKAKEADIKNMITKLFGSCPSGLTSSDLYNKADKVFEMWQPNYKADIYAGANITSPSDDTYQIIVSYFSDKEKKQELSTHTITVKKNSSGYYIQSMS